MIATQCASFVGALASVHKLSWLDSVNFGPHELWVITITNSKHIVNNLNSYEGINLIQSFRSKLQLPDLVCTFCQNSLLRKQLYTDVFCQSLASGAGRAAQLPTYLFRIQIAKFGLWAGSLPLRGLEPLSSVKISEDKWRSYPVYSKHLDLERLVLRELTGYYELLMFTSPRCRTNRLGLGACW